MHAHFATDIVVPVCPPLTCRVPPPSLTIGTCFIGLGHIPPPPHTHTHTPPPPLQLTFLLDDAGIPLNYRHMPGFGVHTMKLINKAGRETYVKFHWVPKCGEKYLLDDEAVMVGGANHSHATKDLFDAIAAGACVCWTAKRKRPPNVGVTYGYPPITERVDAPTSLL